MPTLDELRATIQAIAEKQEAHIKRATSDKSAATRARNAHGERLEAAEKQVTLLTEAHADLVGRLAAVEKVPTPNAWPDVAARLVDALKTQPILLLIGAILCFALSVGGVLLHLHPDLLSAPAHSDPHAPAPHPPDP